MYVYTAQKVRLPEAVRRIEMERAGAESQVQPMHAQGGG